MTQAFDISTYLTNSVQYIQQIILTNDGSNSASATTGIILDGSGGNAFFGGQVGIGTTGPIATLDVSGDVYFNTSLIVDKSFTASSGFLVTSPGAKIIASYMDNLYLQ